MYRCHSAAIDQSLEELQTVWAALVNLGVPADNLSFSPKNVRGLDYYSGVVFETFLIGRASFGSVASGGRYDDLASTFTSLKLPGVGGSIGVTRLFSAATREGFIGLTRRSESQVFVGFRTPELRPLAQTIAAALRACGFGVDLFSASANVSKQLSYAARKGITVAVVAMAQQSFVVRDLKTGRQIDISDYEEIAAKVKPLVARP